MLKTITIAIACCLIAITVKTGRAEKVQTSTIGVVANVEYALKWVLTSERGATIGEKSNLARRAGVEQWRAKRPAFARGSLARLQDDDRFWNLYSDFDPDAVSMRGWRQFACEVAGND